MAIKWSVTQLKYELSKDGKSNVVTSVVWKSKDEKEVTKDGNKQIYTSVQTGDVSLDTSDLSSFIKYSELNEDTVVGWVKAVLGNSKVQIIENKVKDELDSKVNPTTGKGKPW